MTAGASYFDAQLGEFKRLELMMQTKHNPQNQNVPHDASGRRIKRTSTFLLVQLAVSVASMPVATPNAMAASSAWSTLPSNPNPNASNCTGSNPCYDIYQGTLAAMQAAAPQAQPSGLPGNWVGLYYPTAFTGGLMVSGPMNYNLSNTPPNSAQTTLTSWTAVACPTSGGAVGSYDLSYTVSNELELTADTSIENSSSTSMSGTAEVAIAYKSPSTTGGIDPSASFSFDYGTEFSSTTSTGFGVTNTAGTSSTLSQEIEYNIPEGYAQTFYLVATTSTYAGIPWTAPIALGGTLGTVTYTQMAKSTGAMPTSTQQVNYNGTMVNANVWIPPQVWSASGSAASWGMLASPSGTYVYMPTSYAALAGYYIESLGNAPTIYWEGELNGTKDQGMQLRLDTSCDSSTGCAGLFWGSNYSGSAVAWDSNTSPQYVAMQDDGNLVGYSSTWQVLWSSKSGKGVLPPPFGNATPTPTPATVLPPNAFAFTASGTYSSTAYTSDAQLSYGNQVPLTQDQINKCNNPTNTSSINAPNTNMLASSPEAEAGYVLVKTSTGSAPMIVAQNDDRRRDDRRPNDGQRREVLRQDVEQQQQRVNPNAVGATPVDPAADALKAKRSNKVTKLKKLKSPMELRKDQYYATTLPGFKVVKLSVRSENLNNKFITEAGPTEVESSPIKTREIKWNPGLNKKMSVKGRSNI